MNADTKNGLRALLACTLTLIAILAGYITLTAPLIATGGPAIITVAAAVAAYFTWRSPPRR